MTMKRMMAAIIGLGLLGALGMAALAVVTAPAAAQAAQTAPATGAVTWAGGKITAVQAGGFTIQDRNGQARAVTVGANTWIVVQKNNAAAEGAVADLKVGDSVSVGGVASGANQIAARTVQAGGAGPGFGKGNRPGGFGGRGGFGGFGIPATVQSVSNGSLTLTIGKDSTNTHTLTVNTDAGTVVIKNGLATVADLKAGDTVQITPRFMARVPGATKPAPGTQPANPPTFTADVIAVTSTDHTLVASSVQSVSGNTVTLHGERNSTGTTVNVDANTTFKLLSTTGTAPAAASLSDLKAGTRVLIYSATPAQGQTGTASVVLILPQMQKPQPGAPNGVADGQWQ